MTSFLLSPSAPLLITLATVAFAAWLAVWMGHTDRSREEINILRSVIRGYVDPETRSAWNEKVFADAIGVSHHQLSRIFNGQESLNFHRLADLPESFRRKWDAARAEARGARVYEADELAFFRGLATLPRKARMLKMSAPVLPARKEA